MEDFESEKRENANEYEPVTLPAELFDAPPPNKSCENGKAASTKKSGVLTKVLSALISVVFCGVAVIYMTVQTVDSVDRLISKGVDEVLLNDVFGAVREETKETKVSAELLESSVESSETEAAPQENAEVNPTPHPIIYESLANSGLLDSMSNETAYTPNLEALLKEKRGVGKCDEIYKKYGNDAPIALIVHTHGTEAYVPDGTDTYTELDSFRSSDTSQNVVAVGDVIAKVLESEGINVIHCTEMFDAESYRESYSRSFAAVAEYLEKYPSIAYVFDVHRDSVIRDDKTNIATLAEAAGERCAQAMIVVGTDEGGADHEDWEDNLSLALHIQSEMASISESVPRKINLRSAAFNQGLSAGSLLLEIGSCANTLTEAKRAAVVAAFSIAGAIKDESFGGNIADELEIFVP